MLSALPASGTRLSDPFDEVSHNIDEPEDLTIHPAGTVGRGAAEQYIRTGFFKSHRADIQSFMPVLVSMQDPEGHIGAALGYRPADDKPLFLERYLREPVHTTISRQRGCSVPRGTVVEIGNLACGDAEIAARLMWAVARHLVRRRYRWVVFTGTRSVRKILRIFPAQLIELGEAHEACAGDTGDAWGRYYRADPRVLAGFLPDAFPNQHIGAPK